jgi:hypothetical protein
MLNDITGSLVGGRPAADICLKKETLLSPFRVEKMIAGLAAWILAITALKSVPPSGTYSSPTTASLSLAMCFLRIRLAVRGNT